MRLLCGWAVRIVAFMVLVLGACDLPRDPEDTLETVRGGVMRVGVSETKPWTIVGPDGLPGGIEPALMEAFARTLDSRIEWVVDTEAVLLEALERHELDAVVAGLTGDTPWRGRVALTRPYLRTSSLIGLPDGVAIGDDLDGERVAVRPGDPVASRVREAGGEPVPMHDLAQADLPVLAEDWRLTAWGMLPTAFVFTGHKHVIAIEPGENAFLVHLERFLAERGETARIALAEAIRE